MWAGACLHSCVGAQRSDGECACAPASCDRWGEGVTHYCVSALEKHKSTLKMIYACIQKEDF